MIEPAVASSDATNIETSIRRDGDHYVINAANWWSSGVAIRAAHHDVMGKTDRPAEASAAVADPGATDNQVSRWRRCCRGSLRRRAAWPCQVSDNVRSRRQHAARRGQGFEIAQGRLVPAASITACAPSARRRGAGEVVKRLVVGTAFGKKIIEYRSGSSASPEPAPYRDEPAAVLKAADMMDKVGNKDAQLRSP